MKTKEKYLYFLNIGANISIYYFGSVIYFRAYYSENLNNKTNIGVKESMSKKEHFIELLYKASTGIANAVLVTLGIGLLFESIGGYLG